MIFEKPPPGRMVLFGAFFLATTFCHHYVSVDLGRAQTIPRSTQ